MYFYYQRTQTGQWSAAKSVNNPRGKRGDMTQTRTVKQVILLEPSEYNLTLAQLEEIHPLISEDAA